MNDSQSTDNLNLLRWEVAQMESGARTLRRNHRDVTKQELGVLKLEIAFFEKVSARLSSLSLEG
jgi:hypothetical protein